MRYQGSRLVGAVLLLALTGSGCKREERAFRVEPPRLRADTEVRLTDLQPGPAEPPPSWKNDYEENAYALSEGKRLYLAFNCNGCHAHGGGDIGPALLDAEWRYGGRPEQIYASIMQGRPNGMPAYGGKLPAHQAWQIAAYVRSLGGHVPADAAPGRDDDMKSNPPEHSVDRTPEQNPDPPAPVKQPL